MKHPETICSEIVAQLTTEYTFYYGIQPDQNFEADEQTYPCVFLDCPITANVTNNINGTRILTTRLNLFFAHKDNIDTETSDIFTDIKTISWNSAREFVLRLRNADDDIVDVKNEVLTDVKNVFDINLSGCLLTIDIDIKDYDSVCVNGDVAPTYWIFSAIVVNGSNEPVQGATVELNSQIIYTNAFGVATFSLVAGTYPITITNGTTQTDTVVITGHTCRSYMFGGGGSATLYAAFVVRDSITFLPIQNATISGDLTGTTDVNGVVYIEVDPNTDYDVTITKANYTSQSTTINVGTTCVVTSIDLVQTNPLFNQIIKVIDENNANVSSQAVIVNYTSLGSPVSDTLTTNASGEVTITDIDNNTQLSWSVVRTNYMTATGTKLITQSGSNVVALELTPTTNTFNVNLDFGTTNNGLYYQSKIKGVITFTTSENVATATYKKNGVVVTSPITIDYCDVFTADITRTSAGQQSNIYFTGVQNIETSFNVVTGITNTNVTQFINRLTNQITASEQKLIKTCIDDLTDAGLFAKLDVLQIYGLDSVNGLLNWIKNSHHAVTVNSPTYNAGGYWNLDGASQSIDTNFAPPSGVNFTQTSFHFGIVNLSTDTTTGRVDCGASVAAPSTSQLAIKLFTTATTHTYCPLTAANSSVTNYTNGIGYSGCQLLSGVSSMIRGTIRLTTSTTTSSLYPTSNFHVGANNFGTPTQWTVRQYPLFVAGAGLTDTEIRNLVTILNNYLKAKGII